MEAKAMKIEDFLSQNQRQFQIPVYQRNYDWSTGECKQLLDDVLKVGTNENMNAHFIGSVVYVYDGIYTTSKIKELTIIDGQQRITTLTLIYLALYRLAIEIGKKELEAEIYETYLTNKFVSEKEKLKLSITGNNDRAIKYLLRSDKDEEYSEFSRIIDNFNYFKGRINKENYNFVLTGLSKLMFVEISLDREKDNPQRIFESLNSTGLELSQADLIRNYILMGLNRSEQSNIYENYWEIIEGFAKDETSNNSKVSDFIRDYLTLINKKIPNIKKVYVEFKEKFPTTDFQSLETTLAPIKSLAKFYNRLLNPKKETDKNIQIHLEYIKKLKINVSYPFLMKVYEDYSEGIIDKITFIKVLELIQSYAWRRFIVGLPTNALNKIFMTLYEKRDKNEYLLSLQKSLLTRIEKQRFPKDDEIIESLKIKDFYNIDSKNSTYLLERLENFKNKEPVIIEGNEDITIEHIFPQKPDPKWKVDLGTEEYNLIKEKYLNSLGNLTLLGNNRKLGNKPFLYKRDLKDAGYKDSRLWLNKYLSSIEKWNLEKIKERCAILTKRYLEIWQIPTIELKYKDENNEVNIFEAEDPTSKKLEYAIFFNQKIEGKNFVELYVEIFRQLFDLQPETFFTTDLREKIVLTNNREKSSLNDPKSISDTYSIEGRMNNISKFEKIKHALKIFSFEDELSIKYVEDDENNKVNQLF